METCLKDQVRAYPGLRVDVATNVDHVLEGLCVGRRHGQLRVSMGTVRRVSPSTSRGARPARVSGLQGFGGSRGSPQEAHREERCAQHAAHPKRLNARLCSPSVFSDVTERALSSVYDGRADVLVCVGAKVDCCLSELGLTDLRRVPIVLRIRTTRRIPYCTPK